MGWAGGGMPGVADGQLTSSCTQAGFGVGVLPAPTLPLHLALLLLLLPLPSYLPLLLHAPVCRFHGGCSSDSGGTQGLGGGCEC